MTGGLIIFGAGAHAKVVLDAALRAGWKVAFLTDELRGGEVCGVEVRRTGDMDWNALAGFEFIVAIGDNVCRERLYREGKARGGKPRTLVHPFSSVATSARMGAGCVVCAGAVIGADAEVGEDAIINTSASVDHDCVVGAHAHVCPGARLAGKVEVGRGTLIGTGAVVIPGVRIGVGCVIGAGSVVCGGVPDGVVVYGNPARGADGAVGRGKETAGE